MKTQTFKAGNELVVRITVSGDELDRQAIQFIGAMGPGLCRAADKSNTRPLFETKEKTYELRIPCQDPPDPLQGFDPLITLALRIPYQDPPDPLSGA